MDDNKNQDLLSTVNLEDRPESGWRRRLFIIIFEADTKWGRIFDITLLWAILVSIAAVILESDPAINSKYGKELFFIEWAITIFFTFEYLLRLTITNHPKKYAKSFFGIIDLLTILPAFIALVFPQSQYFMVVRVLRLLRVFRILKLVNFVTAAQQLGNALLASRHKIAVFFGTVLSLILIMGASMYMVEGQQEGFSSIAKSMYWAIVTMTTVGYGDIVPVTTLGKLIASFMMLVGYAIIAVPTGIVSAELMEQEKLGSNKACPRCKTTNEGSSNYCTQCGEALS